MKTFEQWFRENRRAEVPKGNIDEGWFIERGLHMIVECCCCGMSMALPNAMIDDEGNIYCASCVSDDSETETEIEDYWSGPSDNRKGGYSEFEYDE